MATYAVGGGKVDVEGFGKSLLHLFRTGYSRGMSVTQRGAGANMSVDVNVDSSSMAGLLVATSANVPYFGYMDATTNVTVTTADPSNPRIDTLVGYIDLSLITSSTTNNNGALKFKAVAGTPAGSPSAPSGSTIQTSIGAGNPYVPLANVAVAAAVSSIVNANLTDLRTPMAFDVPYLWGGTSNTKGHLVPNVADDTVALLAATQTFSNHTIDNTNVLGSGLITLGYAQITSNFSTSSTTAAQVTGLTATVTIPAGSRKIQIDFFAGEVWNSASSSLQQVTIWDGTVGSGTQLNRSVTWNGGPSIGVVQTCSAVVSPGAGTKTYNIGFNVNGNTGTIGASATQPAYIVVKAF